MGPCAKHTSKPRPGCPLTQASPASKTDFPSQLGERQASPPGGRSGRARDSLSSLRWPGSSSHADFDIHLPSLSFSVCNPCLPALRRLGEADGLQGPPSALPLTGPFGDRRTPLTPFTYRLEVQSSWTRPARPESLVLVPQLH